MLPLLLALFLTASPAQAEVVDRVVVVVGEQLVLDSDIRLEAVLSGLDEAASPWWGQGHLSPEERLVGAAVVRHLAGDVSVYQPSDEAVRARLEGIRQHFPDREAWQQFLSTWGQDERGLRAVLRRRMVVERYLERNVRAEGSPQAWLAAADALVASATQRMRIRRVESRQ